MIKNNSTKAISLSIFLSIIINVLIFLLCIKFLSAVYHSKKSIAVVVLNSDILNKPTKHITQTSFKEIKHKIILPNNIPQIKQHIAKETNIKTQQNTIQNTNVNPNQTVDNLGNKFETNKASSEKLANKDSPKLEQSNHIVQNKNSIQNISSQDYAFLRHLIEQHLKYPYIARINAYEGTVVISFMIEDNVFKDIFVVKSSGYSVLDKSAIEAVKNIEPLVKINRNVKIVIPITFKISDS